MTIQIGAQMFTLRDHCGTPSDIAKTCGKLKEMGFGAIQASAAGFNKIEAGELKKILDDNGMVCAATHKGLAELKEVSKVVDWHKEIGCKYTAVGGFFNKEATKADWQAFVKEFSDLAVKLKAAGLHLGYHNHSHEFAPFETDPAKLDPKDTPYELLASELGDAGWFELDTYWVAAGGAEPTQWLKRLAGRVPCIHVKDYTVTMEREVKMCEVGAGNLNWPGILEAAKAGGTEWYLIERDRGDLDPFESLKISLDNLKSWGIQ